MYFLETIRIMKKILYTLSLLCVFLIASCSQESVVEDPVSELEPGTITLSLQTVDVSTKATQVGESAYNENLIKSVHYFFYPKDGTDSNTEKEPAKRGQALNLNKQNQHIITVNASENEIKNILFKYPYNDCDVYVIVNLPSDINIDELPDRKLSTLKKIVLEDANFEANLIQPSFVMEGLSVATVEDRNKVLAAKGTIPVDRVAAKISVSVKVEDQIDLLDEVDFTSGMKWTSNPDKMTIELVNGVNRAVLSGNPSEVTFIEDDFFIDNSESRKFTSTTIAGTEFWSCEPFYTYPTKWEIGSDEEPYLFITLPWTTEIWTEVDGEKPPIYKTYPCYYKIMLGSDELIRNTWYDLKINIGILGSFENTPEVILPIEMTEYFVSDWSTGLNVDSEILGARYLVVDKNRYELYNQNTISIPFTTSHDCEIVDVSCTYPNLVTERDENEDAANYSIDIENGKAITFTHALNNDMFSEDFDFTPYTTTFTIQHMDDDDFKKEITIVQYPAIYAVGQRNSDTNSTGHGNVWVNGYNDDDTSPNAGQDFFGGANGNRQGAYPSMYVFTITTTEGTDFIIGDPRDMEYTYDADDADWYVGDALYDGSSDRELKYYYGTAVASERYSSTQTGSIYASDEAAEAAEPTINMVAPKFRLASGYGTVTQTTGANSLETMKKRCASYQEDGYPAGRWRLPTRAEFQFILTQINLGNLPGVYLENYDYWCAHGLGEPENGVVVMNYISNSQGGGYSSITPVRCVYDEWYWENSETYRLGVDENGTYRPFNTFTWGDMPRDQFDAKTE